VEHDEYRDAKSLIHQLVDTVSKNGNLLLNVGPKADGHYSRRSEDRAATDGGLAQGKMARLSTGLAMVVFGEGPTKAAQ